MKGHEGAIRAVAVSPDGERIITGLGVTPRCWHLDQEWGWAS